MQNANRDELHARHVGNVPNVESDRDVIVSDEPASSPPERSERFFSGRLFCINKWYNCKGCDVTARLRSTREPQRCVTIMKPKWSSCKYCSIAKTGCNFTSLVQICYCGVIYIYIYILIFVRGEHKRVNDTTECCCVLDGDVIRVWSDDVIRVWSDHVICMLSDVNRHRCKWTLFYCVKLSLHCSIVVLTWAHASVNMQNALIWGWQILAEAVSLWMQYRMVNGYTACIFNPPRCSIFALKAGCALVAAFVLKWCDRNVIFGS